jgi:hypothetical protein
MVCDGTDGQKGVFRPINKASNPSTLDLWKSYLQASIKFVTCLSKSALFFRISSTLFIE